MTCKTKQEPVDATGIVIDIGKEVFRLGRFGADGRLARALLHISCGDSACDSSVVAGMHGQTQAPACKTRTWPAWHEALNRRGALTIRVDPAMSWRAAQTGKRG